MDSSPSEHTAVRDEAPATLLPILTGHHEEELPETRWSMPGAQHLDGHPWVWKEFSENSLRYMKSRHGCPGCIRDTLTSNTTDDNDDVIHDKKIQNGQ
ncbi:hypothetical protein C0Q70_11418 [Pomacea canaliculata]|uniref:Uncharacterized protein n=1 Tax=Pomacea canaliculata TaxID=400727 RepID=A0A2T7P605_POMCA|nr:hypothetical protein C0Q70_11418 [Pomacea canaliculata]